MIALCELPTAASASAPSNCERLRPPIAMPPIVRKSRRLTPSQKRLFLSGLPKIVSIAHAPPRSCGQTPTKPDPAELTQIVWPDSLVRPTMVARRHAEATLFAHHFISKSADEFNVGQGVG